MGIIARVEARLAGEPEAVLTALLLAVAVVVVIVALSGRPLLKLALLAWVVAP